MPMRLLLKASLPLQNEGGNVFIGDTNGGTAPAEAGGGPDVHVRWMSGEAVELQHHPQVRVFRGEKAVEGVRIRYLTAPGR